MNERPSFEESVLLDALDRPPAERRAFVEQTCAGNSTATERVLALLRGYQDNSSYLETPAAAAVLGTTGRTLSPLPREPEPGDRIGHYVLQKQIGEGGFGVVFLAEQVQPVQRLVALKVIRLGLDTREFITRFETERQALAAMAHTNIARVFDAGATDSGRPFLVMELVRGVPITEYCDEHRLTLPERLALFLQVCGAIQHAHQKGVIHCDLKPSNVLVELTEPASSGCPKVIDFGIAKATPDRRSAKTLFTRFHALIGTPAYTSPEQMELSGLDVDTRSDVYSLGVLLYELLTGQQPFDAAALERASFEEMRRCIRDVDPPRPSERVRTLSPEERAHSAQRRSTYHDTLAEKLSDDLDWIVMRCLEKDRARRYETVAGLAADLRRHLTCEPVIARPPTRTYRLEKFLRRNRTATTAAAAVFLALLGGFIVSSVGFAHARNQRQAAESARHDAEELVSFLVKDLQPELAHARRLPLTAQVAERAVRYFATLPPDANNPGTERSRAIALETLAWVRSAAGNQAAAASLWRAGLAARQRAASATPNDPLLSVELARTEFTEVAQTHPLIADHAWGAGSPETDVRLAAIVDRARAAFLRRADDRELARTFAQLITAQVSYLNTRRVSPEKTLSIAREAEGLYRGFLQRDSTDVMLEAEFVRLLVTISIAQQQNGDIAGGITAGEEALAIAERAWQQTPGNRELQENAAYAATQLSYRLAGSELARANAVEALARERWQQLVQLDPGNFSYRYEFATAHGNEAEFLYSVGKKRAAESSLARSVELLAPVARSPDDFSRLQISEFKLGAVAAQFGERETALTHLRAGLAWHQKQLASLSPEQATRPETTFSLMEGQCVVFECLSDWAAMERVARELLAAVQEVRRTQPESLDAKLSGLGAKYYLGRALLGQGDHRESASVLQSAVSEFAAIDRQVRANIGADEVSLLFVVPLARAYITAGDSASARRSLEEPVVNAQKMASAQTLKCWDTRVNLAEAELLLAGLIEPTEPAGRTRRHALIEQATSHLESPSPGIRLTLHEAELRTKIATFQAEDFTPAAH